MKVLAINGSPRKNGNTALLLTALLKGCEAVGGSINLIELRKLPIPPCIGCGGCTKTGQCVLQDAMQEVYPQIIEAERIILASPIYFYGITAQAKALVDRCQALWSRQQLKPAQQSGPAEQFARKGLLISLAASHGKRVFDGAILTARYAFDAMGVQYSDELLIRGVDKLGAIRDDQASLQQAEELGRRFMA